MMLASLVSALWARKGVLLTTFVGTLVIAAVVSLSLPKQYKATISLVIDFKSPDQQIGAAVPAMLVPGYIATQVDIMSSLSVAYKVIDDVKLDKDEALQSKLLTTTGTAASLLSWMTFGLAGDALAYLREALRSLRGDEEPETMDGEHALRAMLADSLLSRLSVEPARSGNVIQISFLAPEPRLAARLANAFADAYVETNLQLHTEPARRSVDWHSQRIADLRRELEAAKSRLSVYQQQKGIIITDERLDVENARLADLSRQIVEAQAARLDAESRQRQINQALDSEQASGALPEVLSNVLIQRLKADLAAKEAVLGELSRRLDRNHPDYRRAALEVGKLRSVIQAETKNIVAGISRHAELARQHEEELTEALAAQKARILALKQERDGADVMLRDVESAQLAYENALKRYDDVKTLSLADQTNIAVLSPATSPLMHASPNIKLNMALAGFLGLLFGSGLAFFAELMDRRVRLPSDLQQVVGAPVLGVLIKGDPRRKTDMLAWYDALRNSPPAATRD